MKTIDWDAVAVMTLFAAGAIAVCAVSKSQIERARNQKEIELAKMQHKPSIEIQP